MLKISPNKFEVKALEVNSLDSLDINLDKSPVKLSVDATRIDDGSMAIILFLALKLSDSMGMKVSYAVEFSVVDASVEEFKVTEEVLQDKFFKVNAPAIAYPFLRAFIATFCVNAGYEAFLLPPINFQAMHDARVAREKAALAE